MPDSPVTPEPAAAAPPKRGDPRFAPTPDFLRGLNPGGLFDIATSPAPDEWIPPTPEELTAVLEGYTVTRLIGQGGMGAVYEVRHRALERMEALKFLPADRWASDPVFTQRAQREARMLSRLQHPNIVAVYESSATATGDLFFTMELVHGETLAQRLHRTRMSTAESVALLRQVCDAVDYAHSQKIIHRDLKPSNILITDEGHVKVVDFGLAVLATRRPEEKLTLSGIAVGTFEFSAPEQMGAGQVDLRADIYSLGVIAYLLLTGEVPRGAFDPPSLRRRMVDQGFDSVVLQALQADPERRFATAKEFREALVAAHETALLAGTEELVGVEQAEVLQAFYERSVADIPPTVRHFIEDKLLTPSGYRDSRSLDDALHEHGIARAELQRLVDRRLLRIEERAGVARVEISHDRLTGAIQASRDARRAVDAARTAEERERQIRKRMKVKMAFVGVAGLALAGAVWGWWQWKDKQRLAENERKAGELLLVMSEMTGDKLAKELEPMGRLGMLDPVIAGFDDVFSGYDRASADPAWSKLHAQYLTLKASVQAARGRFSAASGTLEAALAIPGGLNAGQAATARARLMQHFCDRGRAEEAGKEYRAIQQLVRQLPETAESGHIKAMADDAQARAYQSLREWQNFFNMQQSAIQTMEQAIAALSADSPERGQWEHDLAEMYLQLARVHYSRGADAAALTSARRANEITTRLSGLPRPDPRWLVTHADSWVTVADLLPEGTEKENAYQTALKVTGSLVQRDPENVLWLREHSFTLANVGARATERKNFVEAASIFDQAVLSARRVVSSDGTVERWQWDLASHLLHRGYVEENAERPALAVPYMREAIEIMDKFVLSTDAPVPNRVTGLAVAAVNLGQVLRAQKLNDEALQHYTARIEQGRRSGPAGAPWYYLAAIAGWEKASVQTTIGDIPGALRTFAGSNTDLDQAYRNIPRQDWPSPGWPWRRRPAELLVVTINAAGPADKAEAKRIAAAMADTLTLFNADSIPEIDVKALATLRALTQSP